LGVGLYRLDASEDEAFDVADEPLDALRLRLEIGQEEGGRLAFGRQPKVPSPREFEAGRGFGARGQGGRDRASPEAL